MSAILHTLFPPVVTPRAGRLVRERTMPCRIMPPGERAKQILAWLAHGRPATCGEICRGIFYDNGRYIGDLLAAMAKRGEVEVGSAVIGGRQRLTYRRLSHAPHINESPQPAD